MVSDKSRKQDAKERILDVAERLFSKSNFASVSVRSVTSEASVNLSAVNYYFGSKKGLFQAVYVRRAKANNNERLGLLYSAIEAASEEKRDLAISEIISALVTPPIRWLYDDEGGHSGYIRFLARAYLEEADDMANILAQEAVFFEKFIPFIQKILPNLSEGEIYWRIHYVMGVMHHTINHFGRMALLSRDKCSEGGWEESRDRLVSFCTEGFS